MSGVVPSDRYRRSSYLQDSDPPAERFGWLAAAPHGLHSRDKAALDPPDQEGRQIIASSLRA